MNIFDQAFAFAIAETEKVYPKPKGIYYKISVPSKEFDDISIKTLSQAVDTLKIWLRWDKNFKLVDKCSIFTIDYDNNESTTTLDINFKSNEFWKGNNNES